jgi:methionyl-tRNA formyltransferase
MKLSVAIIGRSELMYNTILLLEQKKVKINYIITSKEAPEYAYKSIDFEKYAKENNIGFLHTPKLEIQDVQKMENKWGKSDIGISVNYSGIISKDVIDVYQLGILNAHGGDLPRYRGNACMAWAIINNESKVGLCIHKMIGGEIDSGPIISREYIKVCIDTRVGELFKWMEDRIPSLFLESVFKLSENRNYILELQSLDPNEALRCYPRNPEDGRIDWKQSNLSILRLINASSEPFVGAYCFNIEKKIKIWRAEIHNEYENYMAIPGQISEINKDSGDIIVICGLGKLKITEIEIDDKRLKPASYFRSSRSRLN